MTLPHKSKPTIGVLALQGAVELHRPHIEAAGGQFRAVKTSKQFEEVDAFILPGGESTTMLKLIENFGLWDALEKNFKAKPVWGICAGTILMAEKVFVQPKTSSPRRASARSNGGDPGKDGGKAGRHMDPVRANSADAGCQRDDEGRKVQKSFGLLPIEVERNAYGRQLQSHHMEIAGYEVSFIRAPVITNCDPSVEILAREEDKPVWVRKGQYMASTFHAEINLDTPSPMHNQFMKQL